MFGELVMLRGDDGDKLRTYLSSLDKLRPRMCYRIAVLCVRTNHTSQHDIMHGTKTTASFDNFLSGMGWKVKLKHHRARGCFMGGLDCSLHTKMLYYGSSMREVSFHVVPWMPLKKNDEQQIERKRHVGNDTVHIVWCENAKGYDISSFVSEVTAVFIVLIPLPCTTLVKVQVFCRDPSLCFGPLQDGAVVGRDVIGLLARATAINANDLIRKKKSSDHYSEKEDLHPSFFRRQRMSVILDRLSSGDLTQKDLAAVLFK